MENLRHVVLSSTLQLGSQRSSKAFCACENEFLLSYTLEVFAIRVEIASLLCGGIFINVIVAFFLVHGCFLFIDIAQKFIDAAVAGSIALCQLVV